MARYAFRLLILLVLLGNAQDLFAQKTILKLRNENLTGDEDETFQVAEDYFKAENYTEALPYYRDLYEKQKSNNYLLFQTGVCYLSKTDELNRAVELLEDFVSKEKEVDAGDYFLGRAYMLNDDFEKAIARLDAFKKRTKDNKMAAKAQALIDNCLTGRTLIMDTVKYDITNLGGPVNTKNSEYVPLLSADESVLIFTYRGERSTGGKQNKFLESYKYGEYYEDVFITFKVGDNWQDPESLGENINTNGHDAAIALSADGQKLFIYNSSRKNKGDIYMSTLEGEIWSKAQPLPDPINSPRSWEGSATISADEQTLYFVSDRLGGFGGRDIYKSVKDKNGKWGKPVNLGSKVNTKFDEDAPFIHPDTKSFFFSSQGHGSMGGYDIFFVTLDSMSTAKPRNLGFPLNTTGDDKYFSMTASGEIGYYSSGAKGGLGQQDIFKLSPKVLGISPVLLLVKGSIKTDTVPVKAEINVYDDQTNKKLGSYSPNTSSGKYLVTLLPGRSYKMEFVVEGHDTVTEHLNLTDLDRFVEVIQDFNYMVKNFATAKDSAGKFGSGLLAQQLAKNIDDIKLKEAIASNNDAGYVNVLKAKGNVEEEGTEYFVEIVHSNPIEDAMVEGKTVKAEAIGEKDGKTVSKGGPFKTLLEAEEYKRVVAARSGGTEKPETKVMVQKGGEKKEVKEYYAPLLTAHVQNTTPEANRSEGMKSETRYEEIMKGFMETEIAGVSYKLEIASTDDPSSVDLSKYKEFGEIEEKKFGDGKTRYSFGPFKTLAEVEKFKAKIVAKYPEAEKFFVTVFTLGERKTLEEHFKSPCSGQPFFDFAGYFKDKDLNDPVVYKTLLEKGKLYCAGDLIFTVQVGAFRKPQNFRAGALEKMAPVERRDYPDGITRFTMGSFKTLQEADKYRRRILRNGGPKDAVVTAFYKGERKVLRDLLSANFYLEMK